MSPLHEVTETDLSALLIGGPGSGKSEVVARIAVETAMAGDTAVVLMDGHGATANKTMLHLDSEGLAHRAIFDQHSNYRRLVAGVTLNRSTDPCPFRRQSEDQRQILAFLNGLWRAAQRPDELLDHPSTFTQGRFAAEIILYQPTPVALRDFMQLFRLTSPRCLQLVLNATKEAADAKDEWMENIRLAHRGAGQFLDHRLGGIKRLAQTAFGFAAFSLRCVAGRSIDEILDRNMVFLMDGSDDGTVPKEVSTALFGIRNLQIAQSQKAHFNRTGKPRKVLVIWEEAAAMNLVSANQETDQLRELRKTGWKAVIVTQDLGFLSLEIKQSVKSCAPIHIWLNPNDSALAKEAGEDLSYPVLDPRQVKFVHETHGQMLDSYETVITKSISKSRDKTTKTETQSERPRYVPVVNQRIEFESLDNQIKLKAGTLLGMGPGEFMKRTPTSVSIEPEYVPMLPDPWPEDIYPGLAAIKLAKAIARSQESDFFITPVAVPDEPWQEATTTTSSAPFATPMPSRNLPRRPGRPANSSRGGNTRRRR
jgi:hypothetical protein